MLSEFKSTVDGLIRHLTPNSCKKVQYCGLKVSHSNQLSVNPKQRVTEPLHGLSIWFSRIHNHGEDC